MSDLLNFLSGLGGGYVKGAELMSKRKQALETAKLNNAIRQSQIEQTQANNDITNYRGLSDAYEKSVQDAIKEIGLSATPEDQVRNARNFAQNILSKHGTLTSFAKSSKHIANRGIQVPQLPSWVSDPDSVTSGFATGNMLPKVDSWFKFTDGMAGFEIPREQVIANYIGGYLPLIGKNPTQQQIESVLSQYPVNAKHYSVVPEIKQGYWQMHNL